MLNIILGKFLDWFLSTKIWIKIGKFCAITNIRPFGYVTFPIDDYFKILDLLDPNYYYAFLSTDTKTLSSMMIKALIATTGKKGLFSHGGLIVFNDYKDTKVMHVNHSGFQYQSMLSHLKEIDYLAVLKIPVKEEYKKIVEERIENIKSRSKDINYDWEERLDNDKNQIYCTEELYLIFKDLVSNFKPRKVANRDTFDPDHLLEIGLEVVYCNHPNYSKLHIVFNNLSQ